MNSSIKDTFFFIQVGVSKNIWYILVAVNRNSFLELFWTHFTHFFTLHSWVLFFLFRLNFLRCHYNINALGSESVFFCSLRCACTVKHIKTETINTVRSSDIDILWVPWFLQYFLFLQENDAVMWLRLIVCLRLKNLINLSECNMSEQSEDWLHYMQDSRLIISDMVQGNVN